MTHILITSEIVTAVELSTSFLGVILSLIAIGLSFFVYKISKQKRKQFLRMVGLITAWAIFIIFTTFSNNNYFDDTLIFFYSSLISLLTTLFGVIIIISWGFMFPNLSKIFDKKLLIIAGIVASIFILGRLISPLFKDLNYFGLIMRIIVILPPLLGILMIIKSYLMEKNK